MKANQKNLNQRLLSLFSFNAVLITIILPFILRLLKVPAAFIIAFVFLLAGSLYAYLSGYWVKKYQQAWSYLLFLPVTYLLAHFFIASQYSFWFMPLYLLLSYLGYSTMMKSA